MKLNQYKVLFITLWLGAAALPAFSTIEIDADGGDELIIHTVSTNSTTLKVGVDYDENSLIITHGGTVSVNEAFIGSSASTHNSTTITGTNSALHAASSLTAKNNSSLTIENEGWVYVGDVNTNTPAGGGIRIGNGSLAIESGSQVTAGNLLIGVQSNETGSVSLSGTDTLMTLSENLSLGTAGSDNTLSLTNGATLIVGGALQVGSSNSVNNHLYIDNGGSVTIEGTTTLFNTGTNSINVGSGGHLGISEGLDLDDTSNGFNINSGASLQLGGTLLTESLDKNIDITLDGTNASWTTAGHMYIGNKTNENQLVIQNGASVSSAIGKKLYVGNESDDNRLLITGTNSQLTAQGETFVGSSGSDNTLTIENNGVANLTAALTIGNADSATGNKVFVRNEGHLTAQTLTIGLKGSYNELNLEEGGLLTAQNDLVIGRETQAHHNSFNVSGSNTTVSISNNLIVGERGNNNTLNLQGGNTTVINNLIIGEEGNDNVATATGSNTLLSASSLTVGQTGSDNVFYLNDGATATFASNVVVGGTSGNNLIEITGSNSTFNALSSLTVGEGGSANELKITGGTLNIGTDLVIGLNGSNSLANVAGSNSTLMVAGSTTIGSNGSFNVMNLSDRATASIGGTLDIGSNSTNNSLTVNGEDTRFNVLGNVNVGTGGTGNRLTVENDAWLVIGDLTTTNVPTFTDGAIAVGNTNGTIGLTVYEDSSIEAGYVYIGVETNQSGNILVTGSNSLLKATHDIVVGLDGSNNILDIKNGGTAEGNLIIGKNAGANDNMLNLSGSDSMLTANGLTIGAENNSGNMLNLTNGAIFSLTGDLNIATNNALNLNRGATFKTAGDFNLVSQSTNGFNFNAGGTLEVGGILTATNVIEEGRGLVLDGGQWNIGTNLIIGANTDSNRVSVTGAGAQLTATSIGIGSTNSTGNILLIENEGTVRIEENLTIADGNTLNLSSNGTLEVTGNFNALAPSADNFIFGSNATLKVGGTLSTSTNQNTIQSGQTIVLDGGLSTNHIAYWNVGTDLYVGGNLGKGSLEVLAGGTMENVSAFIGNADSNKVTISGDASAWNISSNLTVGVNGSDNLLSIIDGATVTISNNAYVGMGPSSNNTVTVSGADSSLSILQDLMIGSGGLSNRLDVWNGASVFVGNNLNITNYSTLYIGTGSVVSVEGNYEQDGTSSLEIVAWPNSTGLLDVAMDANFASNATILVYSDGTFSNNLFKTTIVVAGDNLLFGGETASSNTIGAVNFNWDNLITGLTNYVEGTKLIIEGTVNSLSSIIGAEAGSQLEGVADEIDALATEPDSAAANMRVVLGIDLEQPENTAVMESYYGERASSIPANNLINLGMQSVAEQLTMRADNTRERIGVASATANWNKPQGVAGPHMEEQVLQGWLTGYGTWVSKKSDEGYHGYDANLSGFLVGADFSVAKGVLVGVSGGTGRASADKDNIASTDTKTTYGAIYTSIGTASWFLDSSLIYGGSSVESKLGTTFDTTADYDTQNVAFYIGGGKEITANYFIFTPQASLLANHYSQEAYEEKSTDAVGRKVDSLDSFFLQSSMGCNIGFYTSMGNTVLKPEFRAHWLHEFNNEEEDLSYRLIGGNGSRHAMFLQAPEKDILKIGAGLSAKIGDYLELRADLDTRLASGYDDLTLLGSIRYQF